MRECVGDGRERRGHRVASRRVVRRADGATRVADPGETRNAAMDRRCRHAAKKRDEPTIRVNAGSSWGTARERPRTSLGFRARTKKEKTTTTFGVDDGTARATQKEAVVRSMFAASVEKLRTLLELWESSELANRAKRGLDLVVASAEEERRSVVRAHRRDLMLLREVRAELDRAVEEKVGLESENRRLRCELERAAEKSQSVRRDESPVGIAAVDDDEDAAVTDVVDCVSSEEESTTGSGCDESVMDARASNGEDAETRREISHPKRFVAAATDSGRDRRVDPSVSSPRIDAPDAFVTTGFDMDLHTAHMCAYLILFESASRRDRVGDLSRRAYEFFFARHGSRSLGEAHRRAFRATVDKHVTSSAWLGIFSRVTALTDLEFEALARALRFTSRVAFASSVDARPALGVDEAVRSVEVMVSVVGATPSALDVDLVRKSAEHIDGASFVQLSVVVERGWAVARRTIDGARKTLTDAFMQRHPSGRALAHHASLVSALQRGARYSARTRESRLDAVAADVAADITDDGHVNAETFVNRAIVALEHDLVESSTANEPAPLRSARKPTSSDTMECAASLAALNHAWPIAIATIDRWLAQWRGGPDESTAPTVPIPRSRDVSERARAARLRSALRVSRDAADCAVAAARVFFKRKSDAQSHVRRAWAHYAAVVCALEVEIARHRRSVGVGVGVSLDWSVRARSSDFPNSHTVCTYSDE